MDYEVDLTKLTSLQSDLDSETSSVKTISNDFNSSALKKLSGTEIGSLSSKLQSQISRLEKAYSNSNSWFSRHNSELNDLEKSLSNFSASGMDKPIEFKNDFVDLFTKVTVPLITTAAKKAREEAKARLKEHLLEYTHTDKDGKTGSFYVVNTRISVDDYAAYIQKNKMYQNAGFQDGQCMILSQYYASDMLSGKYTSKSAMDSHSGGPAVRMNEGKTAATEGPVLEYVYNEINEGNPVVLQVTQKKSYLGWRHLVTVVGYSSDVKSAADLTPDKILVLDCVDGKVQTLAERNRKLYNQNRNYLAYGPTEKFKASIGLGNSAVSA